MRVFAHLRLWLWCLDFALCISQQAFPKDVFRRKSHFFCGKMMPFFMICDRTIPATSFCLDVIFYTRAVPEVQILKFWEWKMWWTFQFAGKWSVNFPRKIGLNIVTESFATLFTARSDICHLELTVRAFLDIIFCSGQFHSTEVLPTNPSFFGCGFFAYNWKFPAYSGAFWLTVDNFSFFVLQLELFCLPF